MKIKYKRIEDGCGSEEIIRYSNEEYRVEISQMITWDTPSVLDAWVGKRSNVEKSDWSIYYYTDSRMDYTCAVKIKDFQYLKDAKKYVSENIEQIKRDYFKLRIV